MRNYEYTILIYYDLFFIATTNNNSINNNSNESDISNFDAKETHSQ